MKRVLVLGLAATVVLVACADNILKERPLRTAGSQQSATSLSATSKSHSSSCAAYRRQLHQVQLARTLKMLAAHKEQLRTRELSLNAIIADACE
jgi:CO/xanthine dehydrogenase FAD-binding subunit